MASGVDETTGDRFTLVLTSPSSGRESQRGRVRRNSKSPPTSKTLCFNFFFHFYIYIRQVTVASRSTRSVGRTTVHIAPYLSSPWRSWHNVKKYIFEIILSPSRHRRHRSPDIDSRSKGWRPQTTAIP